MTTERPTPEVDNAKGRAYEYSHELHVVSADFARKLERQRDEAMEMSGKYEDRYFATLVQRDALLAALSALVDLPDERPIASLSKEELKVWADAKAAIESVK